jgi:ABC-type transporter Mla subunit MlaD
MKRLIEALAAAVLSAALVALIGIVQVEYAIRRSLPPILAGAQSAAQKFASASDSISDAARRQDRYLDQTSRELNKTLADAHDLLIHTDESLNGGPGHRGLMPVATTLVSDQHAQLARIETHADEVIAGLDAEEKQIRPILASLNQTAQSAAQAAGNPHVAESLERLDLAMSEADATLANLQAITASGNRDARMIESRLRRALKPASLLKSALLRALGIAAPAAEIAVSVR